MFQDDEELKDWEIKDEEPPERLRLRWAKREEKDLGRVICPSCKQPVPGDSLYCLFCGEPLENSVSPKGGRTASLKAWFRRFFRKNP